MDMPTLVLTTNLAILAAVTIGFIILNSRFTDLRAHVDGRIDDLRNYFTRLLEAESERNDANLRRVEDMLLGKFSELDTRLSRIEGHLEAP